jgi:Transcriptional regulatory protein, C terminal
MTGVAGPNGGYQQGLYLQILGPIVATRGDSALELGHARQRTVLAVLALEPGKLLDRSAIIDAVWNDRPPRSAANLIQTYVSRLRRVLRPDGPVPDSVPCWPRRARAMVCWSPRTSLTCSGSGSWPRLVVAPGRPGHWTPLAPHSGRRWICGAGIRSLT